MSNWSKGTVWVTDGSNPVRVPMGELPEYIAKGYSRGRAKSTSRVWVHKGDIEKRVLHKTLAKYLSEGYSLGRLNPLKILISKEGL